MKQLIAIALLLGSVPATAYAACNPHGLSAQAKMCRMEALSHEFGDLDNPDNLKRAGAALLGEADTQVTGTCNLSSQVAQAIKEGSAQAGVDTNTMTRLACTRSHGNPNAVIGRRKGLTGRCQHS